MGSVSVRIQKEDLYLHPDLEFRRTLLTVIRPKDLSAWTLFTDVVTAVWAFTESLMMWAL